MKKIFTLISVCMLALGAMAQEKSYTDDLYVSINGETAGPMTSTITVTPQEDGNYTLSLKNFVLTSEDGDMAVGNVTIADVPVTAETASCKTLEKEADIMLEDGDDPNYDFWMGPMICAGTGPIPVSIFAKMNDEKIYAHITIDLTAVLDQSILVTLGTDNFPEANPGTNYTDDLYVTINGETAGPIQSTINVAKQADGNYTLSLKNFVLTSEDGDMAVGNVAVTDITATETADGIKLEKEAEIMIEDGDDPNYDFWMGPMICAGTGPIPVSVSALIAGEKLTAEIGIDLTAVLDQAIIVTFGSDPTGINSINAEKTSDAIYNLAGQRLAQPSKGINIIGGKKVLF